MKIEMGSMRLADEGDGVGDGDGTVDLRHVVPVLLPEFHFERGRELAAIVEQVDVQEQERSVHLEVSDDLCLLPAAMPRPRTS